MSTKTILSFAPNELCVVYLVDAGRWDMPLPCLPGGYPPGAVPSVSLKHLTRNMVPVQHLIWTQPRTERDTRPPITAGGALPLIYFRPPDRIREDIKATESLYSAYYVGEDPQRCCACLFL